MKALLFTLSLLFLSACDKKAGQSKFDPKTASQDDKALFSLGQMYAQRVKYLSLNKQEWDIVFAGMKEQQTQLDAELVLNQKSIQNFISKRSHKSADELAQEGQTYLEKFSKEEGVKTLKSGLAYKIIKSGEGAKAELRDKVSVHYEGRFVDGKVFDSSKKNNRIATFPLGSVIKAWQEAVPLIGPGGHIRIVSPASLAYGDRGAPPKIPGGATLVFDIELLEVLK